MRILAIDQSAGQNGVCHATLVGKEFIYDTRVHKLKLKGAPRLKEFGDWFLDEMLTKPDLVVMEERISYGSGQRAGGSMVVHEIAGVLKYLCMYKNLPLLSVWPVHLKQWATGKGNASKQDMIDQASLELGRTIPKSQDDLADAYFLSQIGVYKWLRTEPDSEIKKKILQDSTLQ